MKLSELARLVVTKENPDPELYMTLFDLDENGDILHVTHHEIEVEQWDDSDPTSHFDVMLGGLVSG